MAIEQARDFFVHPKPVSGFPLAKNTHLESLLELPQCPKML